MFKLAIPLDTDIRLDDAVTLIGLGEKYPNCQYVTGMLKEKVTLFVLGDLTTREYGVPRKLNDGSTFYPPKDMSLFNLEKYENNIDLREFKIEIKLVNGMKIWVKPATLEPQVYSLFDESDSNVYSQATEYGKLAYSIYEDIAAQKEIKMTDVRVKKFIKLLITASYKIPLIVFDSLNIISMNDLMNLISAGLGIDEGVLEVKKNTCDTAST